MTPKPNLLRRILPRTLLLATIVAICVVAGCSSNDKKNPVSPGAGGGATTSTFTGWFANGNESGRMSITVGVANLSRTRPGSNAAHASVVATGTIVLTGGGTAALTGTFDDQTGDLNVAGGGYTISGIYDTGPPGNVFGGYTGPNGGGTFSCVTGGASTASVYGGDYASSFSGDNGTFLFAVRGTTLDGAATSAGDSIGFPFTGTISGTGTTRPITITSLILNNYQISASGTLNTSTNHVVGTFHVAFMSNPADSGTWSGDLLTP
jgi:hypothetical protein